jgi:hypothetical protein
MPCLAVSGDVDVDVTSALLKASGVTGISIPKQCSCIAVSRCVGESICDYNAL